MNNKFLSVSRRTRSTPFTRRVESAGVQAYTVYNHMLLPTYFESIEADYWHLCQHVQIWDVSCERQIEVSGPDSNRLIQLLTPRDVSTASIGQGLYAPLCDENGALINDPLLIKLADDKWWISIADSDVRLWVQGIAYGLNLKVAIEEAAIWPLAIQGPKAEQLMVRVFGEKVVEINIFRSKLLDFQGTPMRVMRSGYSKRGGFEVYMNDARLAEPLWDKLFALGQDLQVRAGGPNLIERIESGLLSYGNDMDSSHNPFECGLDAHIDLNADIESMSLPALRDLKHGSVNQLMGLVFSEFVEFTAFELKIDNQWIGEVRSQVWSPRYQMHLAMAMIKREFLQSNTQLSVSGTTAEIVDLPFKLDAI